MTTQQMVHIPLESAFLCGELKCSHIGNNPQQCPACGNANLKNLAQLLNREPQSTAA